MAIWQFVLQLIPNQWVLQNPDSVDAFLVEGGYSCSSAWKGHSLNAEDLSAQCDIRLPRASSWHEDLLVWGDLESTDIQVWLEGRKLDSVQVRIDLRSNAVEAAQATCDLAQTTGCMFYSPEFHQVFKPELAELFERMKQSRSASFVLDPRGFIEQLANHQIRNG